MRGLLLAGVWQTWVLTPGAVVYASATPQKNLYAFSIDAEGRVVDLKTPQGRAHQAADRQAATVATWRFAPGAPATGCQVEQTPNSVLIGQTSPARLFEGLAHEGRKAPAIVRRTLTTEGNCLTAPRRRPQVIVYPDLQAFDDRTTDPSWAGLRYDIDADGLVRNVRIVAQYGEASFADTAASSVAASDLLRTAHLRSNAGVAQTCVVPIVFAIPPTSDEDD